MPPILDVGEELDVSVGYAADITSSEWGLSLRALDGELRFFAYKGLVTDARLQALDPPVELRFSDSCSEDESCYDSMTRLNVEASVDGATLILGNQERGSLTVEGRSYQVLNFFSARYGAFTGRCTGNYAPGELLHLLLVPGSVDLGEYNP